MRPKRIYSYLRATGAEPAMRLGPFRVPVGPDGAVSDRFPVTLAAGRRPATHPPNTVDIDALVDLFAGSGRPPRIGYVSPAPAVDCALRRGGFGVTERTVLAVTRQLPADHPALPAGMRLVQARRPAEINAAATIRRQARGRGAATATGLDVFTAAVAAGGVVLLVAAGDSGEYVAAGRYTAPRAGVTEIAGVWVAPRWRHRGIAIAVCAALTGHALDAGLLPFLRSRPDRHGSLYARHGYRPVAEVTVSSWRHPVPEVIRTPRLVLVPLEVAVAARLSRRLDGRGPVRPGDRVAPGLVTGRGWPHLDSPDLLRSVGRGTAAGWLVTMDGTVIGECGSVDGVDARGDIEVSYGLAEPYRGLGYASELVPAFSGWLAGSPLIDRVVAATGVDNTPSRHALDRAGFRLARLDARVACYTLSTKDAVPERTTVTPVSSAGPAAAGRT